MGDEDRTAFTNRVMVTSPYVSSCAAPYQGRSHQVAVRVLPAQRLGRVRLPSIVMSDLRVKARPPGRVGLERIGVGADDEAVASQIARVN
jgi:hypothetical protein